MNYGTKAQIRLAFNINGIWGARPTGLVSMVTPGFHRLAGCLLVTYNGINSNSLKTFKNVFPQISLTACHYHQPCLYSSFQRPAVKSELDV